jgi:hypothetical protein
MLRARPVFQSDGPIPPDARIELTRRCFDDALDFIAMVVQGVPDAETRANYRVVHGLCKPTGREVVSHAWVEVSDAVVMGFLVNGKRMFLAVAADDFARLYQPFDTTRYSIAQAVAENDRSGHYGPWVERYDQVATPHTKEILGDWKLLGMTDLNDEAFFRPSPEPAVFVTFTVFKDVSDFPGKIVVRRFESHVSWGPEARPTRHARVADTLAEARALLPDGLVCTARDPEDSPTVVETWL